MSPKRKFRSISKEKAQIIWDTVEKTPTGWKYIMKASRKTGLSRPTIYAFLSRFPQPERTRKIEPAYVGRFRDTEGYKKILRYNTVIRKVVKSTRNRRLNFAAKCFNYLGKKDPIYWTIEDFRKLQNNPEWIDHTLHPPQMGSVMLGFLRNYMMALGHTDWLDEFLTIGTKRPPTKKHWYFKKHEVKAIARNMDDFSARALFLMACKVGNRIGTFLNAKFKSLHLDVEGWETWEALETKTKGGRPNTNELSPEIVAMLQEYIEFMKHAGLYGSDKKIFPRRKAFYTRQLRNAAKKAGLCENCYDKKSKKTVDYCIQGEPITWHITRHTFASLNAQEGVALQHIMDQGPWDDAKTLLDFYAGLDRKKVREDMAKLKLIE